MAELEELCPTAEGVPQSQGMVLVHDSAHRTLQLHLFQRGLRALSAQRKSRAGVLGVSWFCVWLKLSWVPLALQVLRLYGHASKLYSLGNSGRIAVL